MSATWAATWLRTGVASQREGCYAAPIPAWRRQPNRHNAMADPQVLAQVFKVELPPQLIAPLMTVEAAYLDAALAVIDEEYGGMERYLRQVLEIDVERVRNNYLV